MSGIPVPFGDIAKPANDVRKTPPVPKNASTNTTF